MPLTYAAIVPHSPLLIPEIGKENIERVKVTEKALQKIRDDIKEKNIETLIIISPHGPIQENTFSMNLSPEFEYNLEEFGNFSVKGKFQGDFGLTHKIREKLETNTKLQLVTEKKLDHGIYVPLKILAENLPDIKIIPIYYSGLDNKDHFEFGQKIREELFHSTERIAVIASGELSHCHTKDSPVGYSPRAKKFDKKLIDLIKNNKVQEIIDLETEFIIEAHECGLRSILILLGILDETKHSANIISYEFPFGIGYLVANFKF